MAEKSGETYQIKRKKEKSNNKTKEKKEVALTKEEKKALIEQQRELETIKEEIKEGTKLPQDKRKQLYKGIFKKTLFTTIVLLYFIGMNIGYNLLEPLVFIRTLKISSMCLIIITIFIYEYAYKKDSGKYTMNGIEWMVLAICTILSLHIYKIYNGKFTVIITICGLLFVLYFIIKSIVVYLKEKRKIKKEIIEKEREETR